MMLFFKKYTKARVVESVVDNVAHGRKSGSNIANMTNASYCTHANNIVEQYIP